MLECSGFAFIRGLCRMVLKSSVLVDLNAVLSGRGIKQVMNKS